SGPFDGSTVTVSFPVSFQTRQPVLALFELSAAVLAVSDPASPNATFDAAVASNYAATSRLTKIQLFPGTSDNLGPEITHVSIQSQSGTDYNSFVADATPPVVIPHLTGTLGNNDWYVSSVSLTWDVTDPDSGVTSSSGCEPATLNGDTSGTT